MTIKQQGGVFGRNPTFNDVTIEGTLTFDGDVDINSDLQVDGELIVNRTAAGFGTAIEIKNKGASAGELAIDAGYLTIGKGDVGILFQDGGNAIQPRDVVGLTNSNGLIDLGVDGARFKNLFLAENVVVGSGYGIDFSATAGTGTSELLDDYEEGTWTPAITDLTNAVTATSQGTYTKVGRHVICSFRVTASSLGSASGAIYISGLPFTVLNSNGARCSGAIGFTQNLNLSAAGQTVTIFPTNNQVYAALYVWDATTGTTNMQASELSATGALYGSLEYFV